MQIEILSCKNNHNYLRQWFSKWAESPPWGDFEGQGRDREAKQHKGAKTFNYMYSMVSHIIFG